MVGTQAFEDEVVKPIVDSLFGDSLARKQRELVAKAVPEELKKYAREPLPEGVAAEIGEATGAVSDCDAPPAELAACPADPARRVPPPNSAP